MNSWLVYVRIHLVQNSHTYQPQLVLFKDKKKKLIDDANDDLNLIENCV